MAGAVKIGVIVMRMARMARKMGPYGRSHPSPSPSPSPNPNPNPDLDWKDTRGRDADPSMPEYDGGTGSTSMIGWRSGGAIDSKS